MKTRKEKIDFLKRLSNKQTTMEEVLPANLSIDIGDAGTAFNINKREVGSDEFFNKVDSERGEKIKFNVKIV